MATAAEELQTAAARMISENASLKGRVEVLLPDREEFERRWKEAKAHCADAERELVASVAIVEAVAEALGLDRHGEDDLPAAVRSIKARCEGAERAASAMDGSAYVRGVERERNEWRTRALAAETALVERNRELDAAKAALRNERLIADGLRKDFELAQEAAHKVATMAAEESASLRAEIDLLKRQAQSAGEARDSLLEQIDAQRDLAKALRAQVESLTIQNGAACSELVALRAEMRIVGTRPVKPTGESLRGGAEPEVPAACSVAGCKADLSRSANGCAGCDRLLCAEHSSPIIFRPNVELPDIGVFCPECVAVLRREFTREMAGTLAALVRATVNLAPYPPEVAESVVAIVDMARDALPPEMRPTAPAQSSVPLSAVFFGGPSAEHYIAKAVRTAWISALITSLPSPSSPKAGRWKCRRCGKEQKMNQDYNVIAAWIWNGVEWRHYCTGELQSHAGDRIGDASEVTP